MAPAPAMALPSPEFHGRPACPICGRDDAEPLYATPRTPGRPTHGAAIATVAAAMGRPLMPWQRRSADVGTELEDDGSWAYQQWLNQVQRQAGKTTLVGPRAVELCTITPGALTWFTAQTRQDARDTMVDGFMPQVAKGVLAGKVRSRLSNGSEGLYFPGSSFFRVFAPTGSALHGKANRLVVVDEVWDFDAERGLELEQAITPTFTTTAGQLMLVSAGGNASSAWLRSWVERGRAAVLNGRRSGLAYFEYGVPADHRDELETLLVVGKLNPDGPELDRALAIVLAHHPAAGYTLKPAALRSAAESMRPGEFMRAYANIWTEADERVISAPAWDRARATSWPEPGVRVAFGFDVAPDLSSAAITAAWRDTPGGPIRWDADQRPGTAWLVPELVDRARRRKPVAIAHNGGPASAQADQVARELGTLAPVQAITGQDYYAACAGVLAAVETERQEDGSWAPSALVHRGQAELDLAVSGAGRKFIGDGAWLWWRKESAGSIASLVGGTVATWAFDHAPTPAAAPKVYVRRQRQLNA